MELLNSIEFSDNLSPKISNLPEQSPVDWRASFDAMGCQESSAVIQSAVALRCLTMAAKRYCEKILISAIHTFPGTFRTPGHIHYFLYSDLLEMRSKVFSTKNFFTFHLKTGHISVFGKIAHNS